MTNRTYLTLDLGGEAHALITFCDDGSAIVYLYAVMAASKDVTGEIYFDAEGGITRNAVKDSFNDKALTPYVVGVVERRARTHLAQAKRHLRRITTAHPPAKEKA